MTPFTPIGAQARWKTLHASLAAMSVGDVLTYDEMGELLGLHPVRDRKAMQMAMRRASLELERVDKHATEPIPNKGYRIVEPEHHLVLAKRHQRRAGRQLSRGSSKVVNVDLSGMDEHTRQAFHVVASAFALQMDMNRRFDAKQRDLEAAVQAITEDRERSDEEVAALRQRMERLEKLIPSSG
jgi:hypothetical protein